MCTKALSGTGVEPDAALPLELPPPAPLRALELDELALEDTADVPAAPDKTPLLTELDRAEVELTVDVPAVVVLLARLSTDGVVFRDVPLLLGLEGVSSELVEALAPELAPAPDGEPAVFDATCVGALPKAD